MRQPVIFISYRRDDCLGYAGRLEEALERKYGTGAVFRDIRDIPAGERFADIIATRLAAAAVVLVLIGPRWIGLRADGARRIDESEDFVRTEIAAALRSGCTVVPILLEGGELPPMDDLPEPLRPLVQRHAFSLDEDSWDADLERLAQSLALPQPRSTRRLVTGSAVALVAVASVIAGVFWFEPADDGTAAAVDKLIGTWQAPVRYGWGDAYDERFVFTRFADIVTGTASFLGYPLGIETFAAGDGSFNFVTHTIQSRGDEQRTLVHRYTVAPGDGVLRIHLLTTGGFYSESPLEFTARLVVDDNPNADR